MCLRQTWGRPIDPEKDLRLGSKRRGDTDRLGRQQRIAARGCLVRTVQFRHGRLLRPIDNRIGAGCCRNDDLARQTPCTEVQFTERERASPFPRGVPGRSHWSDRLAARLEGGARREGRCQIPGRIGKVHRDRDVSVLPGREVIAHAVGHIGTGRNRLRRANQCNRHTHRRFCLRGHGQTREHGKHRKYHGQYQPLTCRHIPMARTNPPLLHGHLPPQPSHKDFHRHIHRSTQTR